jgi:hypothetical protein
MLAEGYVKLAVVCGLGSKIPHFTGYVKDYWQQGRKIPLTLTGRLYLEASSFLTHYICFEVLCLPVPGAYLLLKANQLALKTCNYSIMPGMIGTH